MGEISLPLVAYTALAVHSFFSALLMAVRAVRGLSSRRMLLQAAVMGLMSLYWSLIAISSGPAPVIERADMAGGLRLLAGVMAAVWSLFWIVYLPQIVVRRR